LLLQENRTGAATARSAREVIFIVDIEKVAIEDSIRDYGTNAL
jgi:hypothetical protein